tara:strand:+ start:472 stop:792 length:321 start_codon:yes stop_codon:yes gene_type:complete
MAKEVILNLDFLDELCSKPSVEDEFAIEKHVIEIKEINNITELKCHAIYLARQTLHQAHFIATCMERVALLEARIIGLKNPVKQPKTFGQKLSAINAILFNIEEDS